MVNSIIRDIYKYYKLKLKNNSIRNLIEMLKNIIEVNNLSKSFDISSKQPGLRDLKHFLKEKQKNWKSLKICFDIKENEIIGFLGVMGWKTTILKTVV